jgi:tryptophanyl-tRNA synthetase
LTILSALTSTAIPVLEERFTGAGYGDLKKELESAFLAFAEPFRAEVDRWMRDEDALDDVLAGGAARARARASVRLADVYDKIGFLPSLDRSSRVPSGPAGGSAGATP